MVRPLTLILSLKGEETGKGAGDAVAGRFALQEGRTDDRSAATIRGHEGGRGTPHICKTAKRSQFSGVFDGVEWLGGQVVSSPSAPIWHMASFCRNWLRFEGL
jgi:hypothetical protein